VHGFNAETEALGEAVLQYAENRMRLHPVPLDGPKTLEELQAVAGDSITAEGMGGLAALRLFGDELALACLSNDHPRYLSFIPCAPTEAAVMFELIVGASGIYAGSWLEGSGAVYAENLALRWIADLAGLPAEAGGVFVPGGTIGNLSALVTARRAARARLSASGSTAPRPTKVAAQRGSHSSIRSACEVMDAQFVGVPGNAAQRLSGERLRAVLEAEGPETFFAVVATAGTTNFGIVDDLDSVAQVCSEYGIWFHVDGAYGGAGLAAPTVRHLFAGVERADSFIVDPHKWLFAPFDCCALLYREPALARGAHAQKASYLDVLNDGQWNPTEYAIGLTRRARGLPLWFSLATHGTQAYTASVERTLEVTRFAEAEIARRPYLEALREADLSVVVFRRHGWEPEDYHAWSAQMLREEFAFVVPTSHEGETVARFAIVNPTTSEEDIAAILDTMA
jgi:glutamate/tyrosine decarboxylase-like PLP-dependent enzyme